MVQVATGYEIRGAKAHDDRRRILRGMRVATVEQLVRRFHLAEPGVRSTLELLVAEGVASVEGDNAEWVGELPRSRSRPARARRNGVSETWQRPTNGKMSTKPLTGQQYRALTDEEVETMLLRELPEGIEASEGDEELSVELGGERYVYMPLLGLAVAESRETEDVDA